MAELGEKEAEASFDEMAAREWWLGNALGGWASGTVAGARSRKYHALLAVSKPSVEQRFVLLAKMEETALAGGKRVALSSNYYPHTIHPDGFSRVSRFSFDGAAARWTYQFEGRRLAKEVWCAHGRATTYIRYTLLDGERMGLEVVPLVTGRRAHGIGLPREMEEGKWLGPIGERRIDWRLPTPWSLFVDDGLFRPARDTYHNFVYPIETERGEADREDLHAPGRFELLLHEGHHVTFTASAEGPYPQPMEEVDVASHRIERLVEEFRTYNGFGSLPALESLVRAGDAFIVRHGRRHNIVAGYPYFGLWARDAMIALPGLCIYTGRHALARDIIDNWMEYLRHGMLPGRLDERGRPVYETADGFLWMMWAIGQLEDEGGLKADALARWWPSIRNAMRSRIAGNEQTRLDGDGLLMLTHPRGTWMDAEVDGHPATPRGGKRVEINALWTHALARAARFGVKMKDSNSARLFDEAARAAREGMRKFHNEYAQYFDDGIEPTDGAMRPNQLWALALPEMGISSMQQRAALSAIKQALLVPGKGLRTLDEKDPSYAGHFCGGQRERDLAYHNGAIWPWLMGAYVEAHVQIYPQRADDARKMLEGLVRPDGPGALLSVPEVFDPSSGKAGGCPAQAWSVGECLRALVLLERIRMRTKPSHLALARGERR